MARCKRMVSIPNSGYNKPNFLRSKFDFEYFTLSLMCSAGLVVSVVLPFVSVGYALDRIYLQMVVVLSPFFVIGAIATAKFLRVRIYWIILLVTIPFFMCTTGTMYQVFDVPRVIILNSEGDQYNRWYIHEQEGYAAKWLGSNADLKSNMIYTDSTGGNALWSQGEIPLYSVNQGLPLIQGDKISGYIYLRYYNVVDGKLLDRQYEEFDITEYQHKFEGASRVYSNGGSEIWRVGRNT